MGFMGLSRLYFSFRLILDCFAEQLLLKSTLSRMSKELDWFKEITNSHKILNEL